MTTTITRTHTSGRPRTWVVAIAAVVVAFFIVQMASGNDVTARPTFDVAAAAQQAWDSSSARTRDFICADIRVNDPVKRAQAVVDGLGRTNPNNFWADHVEELADSYRRNCTP